MTGDAGSGSLIAEPPVSGLGPPPPGRRRPAPFAAWLCVPVITLICVLSTLGWREVVHPDWLIARQAGVALFGHLDLGVYADHPRAQMGPLALLIALLPRPVGAVLVALLLAVPLAVGASLARSRRQQAVLWAGGVLAVEPWTQLAWKGHADDALVITGAFIAVWALSRRRYGWSLAGGAVALLGKPTAIALLAVAAPLPWLAAAYAALTVVIYGPFLVADVHGFFSAGRGIMPVGHDSLAAYLGYRRGSPIPLWVRPVQLVVAPVTGLVAGLRDRPWEGLCWIFAVRALVDTNPAPAYSIPLVLFAVPSDLRHRYPLLLAASAVSFWLAKDVPTGAAPGWPRLLALLCVLAICAHRVLGRRLPEPSAAGWSEARS